MACMFNTMIVWICMNFDVIKICSFAAFSSSSISDAHTIYAALLVPNVLTPRVKPFDDTFHSASANKRTLIIKTESDTWFTNVSESDTTIRKAYVVYGIEPWINWRYLRTIITMVSVSSSMEKFHWVTFKLDVWAQYFHPNHTSIMQNLQHEGQSCAPLCAIYTHTHKWALKYTLAHTNTYTQPWDSIPVLRNCRKIFTVVE